MAEEEGKRSPLHEWHVAHGADIMWDGGYPWANHEGTDPSLEYEAIRTGTGIWDLFSTAITRSPDPTPGDCSSGASRTGSTGWSPARCGTGHSSTPTA
jgi:hypothetical protein